ncbi:hypothetical protein Val02_45230 [Virgisporangium aliadipatigenens]|uniref:Uncharacterized protein n=1 Tax=Virgisporangium aliadipatigenens TaxID=741659 RepID=A0A8J4DSW0_9ACTN|nr:hypothetical protein [Virgisporangium aliadipatigenens]GIJ47637.1 hypothetical protein Val02_45230 [Virgisporangium aliadipatigenens]
MLTLPDGFCLAERIVPVASGVYVHTGPMEDLERVLEATPEYVAARDAQPIAGTTRAFIGPLEPDSTLLDRWLAIQRRAGRDDLLLRIDGRDVPLRDVPDRTQPAPAPARTPEPAPRPSGVHLGTGTEGEGHGVLVRNPGPAKPMLAQWPTMHLATDHYGGERILEVVGRPWRNFAAEYAWVERSTMAAQFAEVRRNLALPPGESAPLGTLLPHSPGRPKALAPGLAEVTVEGRRPRPDEDWIAEDGLPGLNFQHTVGVPTWGVYRFLSELGEHTRYATNGFSQVALRRGLMFADEQVEELGEQGFSPRSVESFRGYLALLYTQLAAELRVVAKRRADKPHQWAKSYATAVSRTDLSGIRKSMSPAMQLFLDRHADTIANALIGDLGEIPSLRTDETALTLPFDQDDDGAPVTVRDVLDTALRGSPARDLNQDNLLGIERSRNTLDTHWGALGVGMVLLEWRSPGSGPEAPRAGGPELDQQWDWISDFLRDLFPELTTGGLDEQRALLERLHLETVEETERLLAGPARATAVAELHATHANRVRGMAAQAIAARTARPWAHPSGRTVRTLTATGAGDADERRAVLSHFVPNADAPPAGPDAAPLRAAIHLDSTLAGGDKRWQNLDSLPARPSAADVVGRLRSLRSADTTPTVGFVRLDESGHSGFDALLSHLGRAGSGTAGIAMWVDPATPGEGIRVANVSVARDGVTVLFRNPHTGDLARVPLESAAEVWWLQTRTRLHEGSTVSAFTPVERAEAQAAVPTGIHLGGGPEMEMHEVSARANADATEAEGPGGLPTSATVSLVGEKMNPGGPTKPTWWVVEMVPGPVRVWDAEYAFTDPMAQAQTVHRLWEALSAAPPEGALALDTVPADLRDRFVATNPEATVYGIGPDGLSGYTGERLSGIYLQYTAGVPVWGLYRYFDEIGTHSRLGPNDKSVQLLHQALRYGAAIGARVAQDNRYSALSVESVKGFMTLLYTQTAALITSAYTEDPAERRNPKNLAVALARNNLARISAALPLPVQLYLRSNADRLIKDMLAQYRRDNPSNAFIMPLDDEDVLDEAFEVSTTFDLREVFDTALRPATTRRLGQHAFMGVRTDFEELDNHFGALADELVLMEGRNPGPPDTVLMGEEQFGREWQRLQVFLRSLYPHMRTGSIQEQIAHLREMWRAEEEEILRFLPPFRHDQTRGELRQKYGPRLARLETHALATAATRKWRQPDGRTVRALTNDVGGRPLTEDEQSRLTELFLPPWYQADEDLPLVRRAVDMMAMLGQRVDRPSFMRENLTPPDEIPLDELAEQYRHGGGFVRFTDAAGDPARGFAPLVRHLSHAGAEAGGIAVFVDPATAATRVLDVTVARDGVTVVFLDPATNGLARVPLDVDAEVWWLQVNRPPARVPQPTPVPFAQVPVGEVMLAERLLDRGIHLGVEGPVAVTPTPVAPVGLPFAGGGQSVLRTPAWRAAPAGTAVPVRTPVVHSSVPEAFLDRAGADRQHDVTRAVLAAWDHLLAGDRTAADGAIKQVKEHLAEPEAKAKWAGFVIDSGTGFGSSERARLETLATIVIECR